MIFELFLEFFIVYDFVWDRGSMVAINVSDRTRYSELISSLLSPNGEILIQCIERERGPPGAPHNLTGDDLQKFYAKKSIEKVDVYELDDPVKVELFGKVTGTCYKIR